MAVRLTAWLVLAIPFAVFIVQGVLGLDPLFAAAVLTMAVLPPPFVIPLYMGSRPEDLAERDYVADTLSLATVVTLVAFSIVAALFSGEHGRRRPSASSSGERGEEPGHARQALAQDLRLVRVPDAEVPSMSIALPGVSSTPVSSTRRTHRSREVIAAS